eukprot:2399549-Amphidinium_carterae.1
MVRNARSDKRWDWSDSQDDDLPEGLDLEKVSLTPISELTMHKEPYEDPTPNPWADIEQHPTFEGGRSLNDKGI